jgi:hypothetical protein
LNLDLDGAWLIDQGPGDLSYQVAHWILLSVSHRSTSLKRACRMRDSAYQAAGDGITVNNMNHFDCSSSSNH